MQASGRAASLPTRAPAVFADQVPAGENVDQATQRTVRMMAGYIRDSMRDPLIQAAALDAVKRFAPPARTPRSTQAPLSNVAKCWAVFWWIKHCVTFRSDEDALLYLGLIGEQDMLTSPSVLLRMKKPQEDCDGFTMLACAMLACLGVPVYPVAVAVDLNDPQRWSHVFAIAETEQGYEPVDASHGAWPGWMVPKSRINRWQAFDLNGTPVDIPQPETKFRGLHGYVPSAANHAARTPRPVFLNRSPSLSNARSRRRRGVGDDYSDFWDSVGEGGSSGGSNVDLSSIANIFGSTTGATTGSNSLGGALASGAAAQSPWPTGNLVPVNQIIPPGNMTTAAPSSASSASWASALASLGNTIGRVVSPGSYAPGAVPVASPASSGTTLLLLAVGVGAIALFAGKGGR